MATPEQIPYQEFIGNGVTKSFHLDFDVKDEDHLVITVDDVEPNVGDWSLDIELNNVTFSKAPKSSAVINIRRDTPLKRDSSYNSYDNSFRPKPVDEDFDTIWRKLQEMGVLNRMVNNDVKDLNDYVNSLNDETKQAFLDMIQKQGVSMQQLDTYVNGLYQKLANTAVEKGWLAEFVADGNENQAQINKSTFRTTTSIQSMLDIQDPKNGQVVIPKSFWGGFYAFANPSDMLKGGGEFQYIESNKEINNGVTIFNGWTRLENHYQVKASWSGATGLPEQDAQEYFTILSKYLHTLDSLTPKTLHLDGSVFYLKSVVFTDIGDGSNSAFNMCKNLTIFGDSYDSTVIKIPDQIMLKFGKVTQSSKIYSVFSNFYTDLENMHLKDFQIDFNVENGNYYTTESQNSPVNVDGRLIYGVFCSADFKTRNFVIEKVKFKNSWSHNSIVFGGRKNEIRNTNIQVKECVFDGAGDGVFSDLTINKVIDHSSIYMCGKDLLIDDCKFYNTFGAKICCAIEMHNFGIIKDSIFNNFTVPMHGVSEENIGCDIVMINNTVNNAIFGFSFDCKDVNSKITAKNNIFNLSSAVARKSSSNNLTYAHGGVESSGYINGANYSTQHDTTLIVQNNSFEQAEPSNDWTEDDKYINACFSLQEVKTFIAKGNVFKNFKGPVLRILRQNGLKLRLESRFYLENNTYINCGYSSDFNEKTGAYIIEGEVNNYAGLGALTTFNEKFYNCNFGSLLSMPNNSIALFFAKIHTYIYEKYINPYFCNTNQVSTSSEYYLDINYFKDPESNLVFREPSGLSCDLKFNTVINSNTAILRYIKPLSSLYKLKAEMILPVNLTTVGFIPQRLGDSLIRLDTYYNTPQFYYYVRKDGVDQWVGTGVIK